MLDRGAGGIGAEVVAALPVMEGPNGARAEAAAAIRTDVAEEALDARAAEGAFKRADHRFGGTGGKRGIAVLAGGS